MKKRLLMWLLGLAVPFRWRKIQERRATQRAQRAAPARGDQATTMA